MADTTVDEGVDDGDIEVEALPRRRGLSGKKLVLFILLPLVLLGGAGSAAYFTGHLDEITARFAGREEPTEAQEQASVYFDLPDLLVNLNSAERRGNFLKLSISLELTREEDIERVKQVQPRIVDGYQVYLRELRMEDLQGSSGMQRLREELLLRVNTAAHPIEVRDVLFRQMLVQ